MSASRVKQLYQHVFEIAPQGPLAMQAKAAVAGMDILLGNDAAAHASIDRLIADFNDHPTLPQTLFRIGEEYYNKASQMENKSLKTESENCLRNAITVWEKIIPLESHTIYSAHVYYFSATCYRRLGQHEKAINYYQAVVDKWPKYEYAWLALLRTVHTYEHLKRSGAMPEAEANSKIQSVYERILAEYPESSAANEAHRWFSFLDRRLNSRTNKGERK